MESLSKVSHPGAGKLRPYTTRLHPGTTRKCRGGACLLPGGGALLLTLLLATPALHAQPEAEPPASPAAPPSPAASVVAPAPEPGVYQGPASCASSNCHGSTQPRNVFEVLQNEYFTWLQRDRHSKAQELLYGEESRLVARNLGLGADPAEAPACLACHGFLPPPEIRGALELEDGISCEACHGPASGWLGSHTEESWTTADSVAAGMIDLASPQRRAALCLGCHVGDGERRVDHRLLAAGHPRLNFEMESFSAGMPEHWKPKPPLEEARAWAVGQAAALAAELSRVAVLAERGAWPELSLMSCGDCHHALAEERWRRPPERRGPGATLGLPRRSPAHWTVLRPLVRRFAPGREEPLERALARLSREVGRFGGDPAAAAQASREARAVLEEVTPALASGEWSEASLVELLEVLAAEERETADQASAEQVFWGVNTLAAALIRLRPEVLTSPLPDAVERLYAAVQNPHGIDEEQLGEALERVRTAVRRLR